MQRRFNQPLFVALSLSVLFTSILFAQSKSLPAQRWEYKTIDCNNTELIKLGDEGWELVGVNHDSGSCRGYILKRLKTLDAPRYVDPNERPKPTTNAPTCNITLAQAPAIRGLRLGMTAEDLLRLFPGSDPNYLAKRIEQTQGEPYFGVASLDFNGSQHQEREPDIYFQITLLDKRVVAMTIRHTFTNQTSYGDVFSQEQFIEKMAAAYKLPAKESWIGDNSRSFGQVVLKCKEVEFQLNHFNRSFSIIDPSYFEKQQQRMTESLAKKRAEFKP